MRYVILVIALGLIAVAAWPLIQLLMTKIKNAYSRFMGEVKEELEDVKNDDSSE